MPPLNHPPSATTYCTVEKLCMKKRVFLCFSIFSFFLFIFFSKGSRLLFIIKNNNLEINWRVFLTILWASLLANLLRCINIILLIVVAKLIITSIIFDIWLEALMSPMMARITIYEWLSMMTLNNCFSIVVRTVSRIISVSPTRIEQSPITCSLKYFIRLILSLHTRLVVEEYLDSILILISIPSSPTNRWKTPMLNVVSLIFVLRLVTSMPKVMVWNHIATM